MHGLFRDVGGDVGDAPRHRVVGQPGPESVEPGEFGLEEDRFAVELDEVLLRDAAQLGIRKTAGVHLEVAGQCGPTGAEKVDDLVAGEVVRLRQRDAELGRPVDAGQLAAHPLGHDVATAVGQRVGGPLGAIALTIHAHLGEQSLPLEPADRVIERAVLDRHEPVVAAMT